MRLPESDLVHILDHTRDLWEDLRGAHLFITGGTGFFGIWLLESFLFANQQLDLKASASVLSRKPASFQHAFSHFVHNPAITLVEGNARDFIFPREKFSHIIHAATETNPDFTDINPLEKFTSNIESTRHVLDFAVEAGVEKILFTSSGAVYGKQPVEITHVPETYLGAPDPSDVNSAYGQSKRASEFLCAAYAKQHGFNAAIARCFAFVGPCLPLNSNYAIGNFIRDALNGNKIQIGGDGTPYRSYLYAADLAIWLWTILLRGQTSHPYNVGSESDLTILQLAKTVADIVSPGLSIQVAKNASPNKAAERYVPSTQRAKNELGLQQFISLEGGIKRTVFSFQEKKI